jgi:hypothetical protein
VSEANKMLGDRLQGLLHKFRSLVVKCKRIECTSHKHWSRPECLVYSRSRSNRRIALEPNGVLAVSEKHLAKKRLR